MIGNAYIYRNLIKYVTVGSEVRTDFSVIAR